MNSFLLVWNPKKWRWVDLEKRKKEVQEKGYSLRDWSCGTNKSIQVGDRVFIIRLGEEPRGVFASGEVVKERHEKSHWDKSENRKIGFVTVKLDVLLNPKTDPILPLHFLKQGKFRRMHWESQMSGVSIPEDIADLVEKELSVIKGYTYF